MVRFYQLLTAILKLIVELHDLLTIRTEPCIETGFDSDVDRLEDLIDSPENFASDLQRAIDNYYIKLSVPCPPALKCL